MQHFKLFVGGYPQERIHEVTNGKFSSGFGGCVGNIKISQTVNTFSKSRAWDKNFPFYFNDKLFPSKNFMMYHCTNYCSLDKDPEFGYDQVMPWYYQDV